MQIPQNWTFKSDDIANNFDRHVREQLPWYDLLTFATAQIARHYIPEGGLVYDIGCATGNIGRILEGTLNDRKATSIGIDNSEEMLAKYDATGDVFLSRAQDYNYEPFNLALCFLTLMFIPIDEREALLSKLNAARKEGAAIIIVDKFESAGGYLSTALWRMTLACNQNAGVDPAETLGKEMSLVGVQRPMPPNLLGRKGTEYFRFGDFRAYLVDNDLSDTNKTL